MFQRINYHICISYLNSAYHVKGLVYNNTIITRGDANNHAGFSPSYLDTLIFKNNIVDNVDGKRSVLFFDWGGLSGMGYMDFDYNQYYQGANAVRIDINSSADHITFSQWQAKGYDVNSTTNQVSFIKLWTEISTDYNLILGSAGIDDGINLSSIFTTDLKGVFRPKGNGWDKGALEY